MRPDGRTADEMRELAFDRGFTSRPGGSVRVRWGETHVLCTAVIEDGVPVWLQNTGRGWLTSEYAMLPGSTDRRKQRDVTRGKLDGRSSEIQRLIGRSLRACVDTNRFPGKTVWVDCDVLQADGGTRTAAINGAWVAVKDAFQRALDAGDLLVDPVVHHVAAVSVGVVDGAVLTDLCAREDQRAEVDLNLVMTDELEYVEIQGSAEKGTFGAGPLDSLLTAGQDAIRRIVAAQTAARESG